ncbi:MAG TPA: putative toxin-antitoxin system toxin component, PIN family, partial [Anaerolineales bacterium]|nr:putative toxin-antitoxin system toxin component, PIN family [Anaerolineales bacterium]
ISSALGGALVLVLEKWDAGVFSVVVTTDILSEYFEVLNRPKFGLKQETIDKITTYIYQFSEFVIPEEKIRFIEDDPKDDKFLEAAIAGNVDFIVSGDKHLLDLKEFRSVPILSGREFLDWLQRNGN